MGEKSFLRGIVRCGAVGLLGLFALRVALAGPSIFPTGVTLYDPSRAYNSDILFSALNGHTYLIDMNGHVLHAWNLAGSPARMLNPALTNGVKGDIGVQILKARPGTGRGIMSLIPGLPGLEVVRTFGYVDWQGRVIWQWGTQAPQGLALQHHDWELLPNGDTLLLSDTVGEIPGFGKRVMLDPTIYEVDSHGRLVWTWKASQHLKGLGFVGAKLLLLERESAPDYLHMNAMQALGPNRWEAAGDRRFEQHNILISSRNADFVAIISRQTGRVVWRLGPLYPKYKHLYSPHPQRVPHVIERFSGQHDVHMIPEGVPGAGDVLMFDNEGEGGYPPVPMPMLSGSRVLEINPVTRQVVWQYTGTKATFYSPFIGSAQRLPNGNTLIDEGIWGRFIQVTPNGRIVWEYVSPFAKILPGFGGQIPARWVYRIQSVPYDWVPLAGPHSHAPVVPPELSRFHVSQQDTGVEP